MVYKAYTRTSTCCHCSARLVATMFTAFRNSNRPTHHRRAWGVSGIMKRSVYIGNQGVFGLRVFLVRLGKPRPAWKTSRKANEIEIGNDMETWGFYWVAMKELKLSYRIVGI